MKGKPMWFFGKRKVIEGRKEARPGVSIDPMILDANKKISDLRGDIEKKNSVIKEKVDRMASTIRDVTKIMETDGGRLHHSRD